MAELCDLEATELRRLVGAGEVSPVDLVESCIARIEAADPAVNAITAKAYDRARAEAREAEAAVRRGDALGPLHGLPIGVKDLSDTEGLLTTFGSPLFADNVPAADERVVAVLRQAGAIVLAKTNTPEFGAGANTRNAVFGPTRNPFDHRLTCGGSSGGSAVALACGMVPLATGSDLAGSLRTPAAFCGIVGFRPTPGLVPTETRGHGWSPLPVDGPMARTVADAALMLSAMVGDDPRDPLSLGADGEAFRALDTVDLGGLTVAFTEDLGFAPVDGRVRAAFRRARQALEPAIGRGVDFTMNMAGVDEAFATLRAVGFVAAHREKVEATPDKVGPNVSANVAAGLTLGLADVAEALTVQTRVLRDADAFLAGVDAVICPVAGHPPFPWEDWYPATIDGLPLSSYFHWLALAYGPTLAGLPSVALPFGRDDSGLPFGLQIIGRRRGDRAVLSVASAIEEWAGRNGFGRAVPESA
ncbi:amidase [Inquilinus limosus]|uniref:amidase n=1 Tax=Inquilinus limosus TaxID=171674 RepID=UPI0003FFB50D|nr:amidase family protein [Inquilinus limosus]